MRGKLGKTGTAMGVVLVCVGLLTPPTQAMSGGEKLPDPKSAPWMATLAVPGEGSLLARAGCGGTLVTSTKVITAAHCLDAGDPKRLEVHLGAAELSMTRE